MTKLELVGNCLKMGIFLLLSAFYFSDVFAGRRHAKRKANTVFAMIMTIVISLMGGVTGVIITKEFILTRFVVTAILIFGDTIGVAMVIAIIRMYRSDTKTNTKEEGYSINYDDWNFDERK